MTYSLGMYGRMAADRVRFGAYAEALRRAVRPGTTVVDLGAGTGVFTLLAARLGARVFAIEPDDAIEAARALAARNGLADRITFFHAEARDVELPERAGVLVSDLRGATPLFAGHLEAIADARERFLAPGGLLVPARDTLLAAPVESPGDIAPIERPWGENGQGLDLTPLSDLLRNDLHQRASAVPVALAPFERWVTVEYATASRRAFSGELAWRVERAGIAHGARLWFETELLEDVRFDTSPWSEDTIYGNLFLPFPPGVTVRPGDHLRLSLEAAPVQDDWVWSWSVALQPARGAPFVGPRQSTFVGRPLSAERLGRTAAPR